MRGSDVLLGKCLVPLLTPAIVLQLSSEILPFFKELVSIGSTLSPYVMRGHTACDQRLFRTRITSYDCPSFAIIWPLPWEFL